MKDRTTLLHEIEISLSRIIDLELLDTVICEKKCLMNSFCFSTSIFMNDGITNKEIFNLTAFNKKNVDVI